MVNKNITLFLDPKEGRGCPFEIWAIRNSTSVYWKDKTFYAGDLLTPETAKEIAEGANYAVVVRRPEVSEIRAPSEASRIQLEESLKQARRHRDDAYSEVVGIRAAKERLLASNEQLNKELLEWKDAVRQITNERNDIMAECRRAVADRGVAETHQDRLIKENQKLSDRISQMDKQSQTIRDLVEMNDRSIAEVREQRLNLATAYLAIARLTDPNNPFSNSMVDIRPALDAAQCLKLALGEVLSEAIIRYNRGQGMPEFEYGANLSAVRNQLEGRGK